MSGGGAIQRELNGGVRVHNLGLYMKSSSREEFDVVEGYHQKKKFKDPN
jgi:hypothetical protein